ncbi:hypothetical protein FSP39_008081 [Pinctada imbricata]|uniref:Major facilitator superfamily (MFS) profile domain-containing protein n=1 Tax=Pinctada imbricata TaxID=66713 RepID=A0AA88YDG4_PINIB|nr:hypothetical protein FSP39_008081 [Pinctada imbricata]
MELDDVLKVIGECGRYQMIRLLLICLVSLVCAFHALNMVFVGANPKKTCQITGINMTEVGWENVTQNQWTTFVLNEENKAKDKKSCKVLDEMKVKDYIVDKKLSFQEIRGISGRNITFSERDCEEWTFATDVYGPTIVTQFKLVCDDAWLRSTSKTLYFAGRLLGAVIFGQLSDIFGRRPMFFAGLVSLLIAGCVAAASPNMYVFIPFYILQGAAQTGLFLVAFTMCTELVGKSYRLMAGFLIQGFYALGYMALSGIAYLIQDWRYIEVAITVPVILFSVYLFVLPESVRWQLSKNKLEEAKVTLRKVADTNKVHITDEMMTNLNDSGDKMPDVNKKYTIINLFFPLKMLLLSLNVWFNWLVNSMVYYGLSLGTDNLGGDPYINFLIAGAVEIPAYLLCVLCLNRLGRRWPLALTMIVGGACCIASGFIPDSSGLLPLKITLAMFGKFGITASYAIIYLMAAEVFPTVVRNIGMGVSSMCARIGGMLSPQILELQNIWVPLPLIVFGALSALAGFLALLLPETAGRPLPQLIEDVTKPKQTGTEQLRQDSSCDPVVQKDTLF